MILHSASKNIVITGASRGIGLEVTKYLLQKGHRVLAFTRNAEPLSDLLQTYPSQLHIEERYITLEPEYLAEVISARFSNVDVLINNAGALINKSFLETTDNDWQEMLQVNLMSAVYAIRACVPHMGKNAHIVNISSMGGFQGSIKFPGLAAYSTAKGALSILTECLSEELISQGIHVNCLCIGAVQTEMLETAFPGYKAPITAPEMAEYVAHFALIQGKFFNGKIIPVAINNPK